MGVTASILAGTAAAGTSIGTGAAIAIGAGGGLLAAKSMSGSSKAEKAANAQADDLRNKQNALNAELSNKMAGEDAEKAQAQQQARERQRSKSRAASGRAGTILTGQLGEVGPSQGQTKSLLGV
jgi:hypothetical protein